MVYQICALRIQWVGHVEGMHETAMYKRVLKGKLCAKRRTGRPTLRWMDDVTDDLRRMVIRSWTEKARNRNQWRLIVEEAKAHTPGCSAKQKQNIKFVRTKIILQTINEN
jgi:hypothetical protein